MLKDTEFNFVSFPFSILNLIILPALHVSIPRFVPIWLPRIQFTIDFTIDFYAITRFDLLTKLKAFCHFLLLQRVANSPLTNFFPKKFLIRLSEVSGHRSPSGGHYDKHSIAHNRSQKSREARARNPQKKKIPLPPPFHANIIRQ